MNNLKNITRRGPKNKSPGSFYGGIPVGQRVEAFLVLKDLILKYNPEIIIEIGFWQAGMSLFLSDLNICPVYAFDIRKPNIKVSGGNLTLVIKNCHSQETKDYIHELTRDKKTLWLIDGGDKSKEFNFLSDIIKTGELAMTHDFAPDEEGEKYLIENNIWYWWESSLEKLNLLNYKKHEQFEHIWKTAVWGAFVKQ
jgi:hypothetical protein